MTYNGSWTLHSLGGALIGQGVKLIAYLGVWYAIGQYAGTTGYAMLPIAAGGTPGSLSVIVPTLTAESTATLGPHAVLSGDRIWFWRITSGVTHIYRSTGPLNNPTFWSEFTAPDSTAGNYLFLVNGIVPNSTLLYAVWHLQSFSPAVDQIWGAKYDSGSDAWDTSQLAVDYLVHTPPPPDNGPDQGQTPYKGAAHVLSDGSIGYVTDFNIRDSVEGCFAAYVNFSLSGSSGTSSSLAAVAPAIFTATPSVTSTSFSVIAQALFSVNLAARKLNLVCNAPPPGVAGQAYSSQAGYEGGEAPYNVTQTGGSLPTGLSVSSDGLISGTPTTPGTYNYTLSIADSSGQTATASCAITIYAPITQSGGSGVCTQQGGPG
jgi:hypothetical protein